MDKITEALKKLLPEKEIQPVVEALQEMLDESKKDLEKEFEAKLSNAYEKLANETVQNETISEEGYQQAYAIIQDLRGRLETQQEEFKKTLEEGYEEAFQKIQQEKGKNNNFEVEIYEEYEKKLNEMRDYMIDKLDAFMEFRTNEMYEHAMREILNDPRVVEQKVVVEKMTDILGDYLSDEDISIATSNKLEEAYRTLEDLKVQKKVLEARNTKLSMTNNKLNENLQQVQGLLAEHTNTEKKERANAGKASGKGQRVVEQGEGLIAEYHNPEVPITKKDEKTSDLVEHSALAEWENLAGITAMLEKQAKNKK